MNRRNAIKILSLIPVSLALGGRNLLSFDKNEDISKFDKIIEYFKKNTGFTKDIGLLTGNIGKKLINTPYEGGTLENTGGIEKCTVTLAGLDCVTFYETALGIARIIQKGRYSFEDLINEVTFTRYRNGEINGYVSRLHYTSDWIYDNVMKNVVEDITHKLGGIEKKFNLNFMSSHPQYYPALKGNAKNIQKIKEIEQNISKHSFHLIPYNEISQIEDKLKTGDIIALTSNVSGLDYAHTGLILRESGVSHFLHASSEEKKVILDSNISEYVYRVGKKQSITVLRPLNVI